MTIDPAGGPSWLSVGGLDRFTRDATGQWIRERFAQWSNTEGDEQLGKREDFARYDWVYVTRAPAGEADWVRQAVAGKITGMRDDNAEVLLYNQTGTEMRYINVNYRWLRKIDEPQFVTATSHIPNTAEVQELKEILWKHAFSVKRTHGLCSVLESSLRELGVQKPPTGKVKATVTFTIETDVDNIIANSTHRDFAEQFDGRTVADRAAMLLNRADYGSANISYEVIAPDHPPVVASATPEPESAPAEAVTGTPEPATKPEFAVAA